MVTSPLGRLSDVISSGISRMTSLSLQTRQRVEVLGRKRQPVARRALGNGEPMPGRNLTALAPLGDGARRMAEFGRKGFDRVLHDGESIDVSSMASSGTRFDVSSIARVTVSTENPGMPRPRTKPLAVTDQQKQIGRRIELAAQAAGFTSHSDLARRLGQDHGTVSKWIAGERGIQALRIGRLAELFDVTTDWLILGDRRRVPTDVMERIKTLALPGDSI